MSGIFTYICHQNQLNVGKYRQIYHTWILWVSKIPENSNFELLKSEETTALPSSFPSLFPQKSIFRCYIWAAEDICYIKQLAGCSYLVLQSRMVFEGLTSYSTPISCLHAVLIFDWLAGGWLLWLALAGLAGWWLAGWLAGGLAGWAWLAGWLGWPAAGWLAGCIYYMIMDGWYLMDVGSPVLWAWIWPRSDLVLTSYWTSYLYCPWICICCIGYINEKRWT